MTDAPQARWLDAHQTMLEVRAGNDVTHIPGHHELVQQIAKTMPIQLSNTPLSAAYANEDHTALVSHTAENGDILVSKESTPALWDYIHANMPITPFPMKGATDASPPPLLDPQTLMRTAVEHLATVVAPKFQEIQADLQSDPMLDEPALEMPRFMRPAEPEMQVAEHHEQEMALHPEMPLHAEAAPPEEPQLPAQPAPDESGSSDHKSEQLPQHETVPEKPEPAIPAPSLPPLPPIEEHRTPDAPIVTDAERRRQATERICFAAGQAGDAQIRYEVALQAKNGNIAAQEMLQDEAQVYGINVSTLADSIIMARTLQEQRVMRAHAIKAQALKGLERMTGNDIDHLAEQAVAKIMEEGSASPT